MKWVYLALAIVSEVLATTALKKTEGFTELSPLLLTVLGFGSAFYFLSKTLNELPMGITYAIWSGAGIVAMALIGYFRFGESLGLPSIIGITLILSGIVVIKLFAHPHI